MGVPDFRHCICEAYTPRRDRSVATPLLEDVHSRSSEPKRRCREAYQIPMKSSCLHVHYAVAMHKADHLATALCADNPRLTDSDYLLRALNIVVVFSFRDLTLVVIINTCRFASGTVWAQKRQTMHRPLCLGPEYACLGTVKTRFEKTQVAQAPMQLSHIGRLGSIFQLALEAVIGRTLKTGIRKSAVSP